jgi:hypothetical protein
MGIKICIGVDFDGTLVKYTGWKGDDNIGEIVPLMAHRVHKWLKEGIEVRIVTARAYKYEMAVLMGESPEICTEIFQKTIVPIIEWGKLHFHGYEFIVTSMKSPNMVEIWDDRAISVKSNVGTNLRLCKKNTLD